MVANVYNFKFVTGMQERIKFLKLHNCKIKSNENKPSLSLPLSNQVDINCGHVNNWMVRGILLQLSCKPARHYQMHDSNRLCARNDQSSKSSNNSVRFIIHN